jgi:hypothetical protein
MKKFCFCSKEKQNSDRCLEEQNKEERKIEREKRDRDR